MSEIPSNDYLEKVSDKVNNNEAMRSEIDTVLKTSSDEQVKLGVETISKMNAKQLAYYIESTFKNGEGWADYQTMLRNPYYAFMVQAAIDLLSDHFGDKKYDKDGNEDSNNGKSLDDWLGNNGIDGLIGSKTRTAVRIVQKLLGINVVDGAAGPQFFEAVCAELKGESVSSDFKVRNKPKYTEKYNFNGKEQTVTISQNGVDVKNAEETTISFKLPNGYSLGNVQADGQIHILKAGNDTGCYLVKNSDTNKYEIKYIAGYDHAKGEFTLDDRNSITFSKSAKPSKPDLGKNIPEGLDEGDFNRLKNIFSGVDDANGRLRFVLRNPDGTIKTNKYGQIIAYSVDDNNDFYYVWDSHYSNNSDTLYNGGYVDYTKDGLYGLVKDNLNCGKFDSLFSRGYNDLQDQEAQKILKKPLSERTSVDNQKLGAMFSNWTGGGNLQRLGARLCTESNDGSGGKNFLNWCEKMKNKGVSTRKLTIRNWFAMSKMGCSPDDDNFIESSQFNKKYKS